MRDNAEERAKNAESEAAATLGKREVEAFLSWLATDRGVAASTRNAVGPSGATASTTLAAARPLASNQEKSSLA